MRRIQFTALDVHAQMTSVCVKPFAGSRPRRWEVPTTIPAIREVLAQLPRPVHLTFEEGPMAGWLFRNLRRGVEEVLVNDPRVNGLITQAGDADDQIDAEKLCDLYRGGYLKGVYHPEEEERAVFKELVSLYHKQVAHRVRQANRIIGHVKQWGCVWREKDFAGRKDRDELMRSAGLEEGALPRSGHLRGLWADYDQAAQGERALHRELLKGVKRQEFAVRLMALPGFAAVRSATWVAYLDTPWRFKSKAALWKYLGIGLTREKSGTTWDVIYVEQHCNHLLRGMIVGAAETAMRKGDNPFRDQFDRWLKAGLPFRQARRNVARSLAAVGWGMWKSGSVYDPKRVGLSF